MSDSSPDMASRRRSARDLIEKCGYAAAALTMIPIPFTEQIAVVPIHVGMVVSVGDLYGFSVTKDSANELLMRIGATVGLSLLGSQLATTAAKFLLPGVGGLISAPFMYASTLAIGGVARLYFENNGDISNSEIKRVYKSELEQARKAYDPKRAKTRDAKRMAEEAKGHANKDDPRSAEPVVPKSKKTTRTKKTKNNDDDPVARLEKLKALLDKGLIDKAEYDEHKMRILTEL